MKCNQCDRDVPYLEKNPKGLNEYVCLSCLPPDPINPSYYLKGKIEVADFIADQKLDYFEGNVVKYICRWRDKGGVTDLNKVKWYIEKLIDQAVEGEG